MTERRRISNTMSSNQARIEGEDDLNMNEQEEDLIYRMHRLVGDRWDLIAGRIPGRTAEEIERFWRIKHPQNNNNNNNNN